MEHPNAQFRKGDRVRVSSESNPFSNELGTVVESYVHMFDSQPLYGITLDRPFVNPYPGLWNYGVTFWENELEATALPAPPPPPKPLPWYKRIFRGRG